MKSITHSNHLISSNSGLSFLFACVLVFQSVSCKKDTNKIHFHGRITVDCDNQTPVKNEVISVHRVYDTGSTQDQFIGYASVDQNGYYNLYADVDQKGSFKEYLINLNSTGSYLKRQFVCHANTKDNSSNVEINGYAGAGKAYEFKIQNTSPINNSDTFNALVITYQYGNWRNDTLVSDLVGNNVDTSVVRFIYSHSSISFYYTSTKNGVQQTSAVDTLISPYCLDTTLTNITY